MKAACLKKEGLTVRLGELLYYVFLQVCYLRRGSASMTARKASK